MRFIVALVLVLSSRAALADEYDLTIDECAAPDIAATLGIPVNTVYSRLRVAREELAAAVGRARARRGER